ncbi:hypothetical protein O3M35_006698 [Rhynocoris fuscipes]|uniref:Uncharacterized protein n=1 Tax=Rhynocoris fuscipes TaxID=488301 RepID=A0AAW1DGS3_9HEMI
MSDYINVIEQIKQSDVKIGFLTKQIKEMEEDIKKTETESDMIKAKNKQLLQDIKCKKKLLDDKRNDINVLQKDLDVFNEMIKDKQNLVEEAEKKLVEIQKEVLNSRLKFNERVKSFVDENDYLVVKSRCIEEATKKREEEKKLLSDIKTIERDLLSLEKQYQELLKELEILEAAEKNKIALESEPDNGEEYKRIRIIIDAYEEELEDIEFKSKAKSLTPGRYKANFITDAPQVMLNEKVNMEEPNNYTYHNSHDDNRTLGRNYQNSEELSTKESNIRENSDQEKSTKNFTPKIGSCLTKRSQSKQQGINKKQKKN